MDPGSFCFPPRAINTFNITKTYNNAMPECKDYNNKPHLVKMVSCKTHSVILKEEIGKGNHMTALRFQTGGTSLMRLQIRGVGEGGGTSD